MSNMDRDGRHSESTSPAGARRPYEAPRVVDSAVFETLALTCGKTDTVDIACNPTFGGSLTNS